MTTAYAPSEGPLDVLCIGETMALIAHADDALLDVGAPLTLGVGGAESNVAIALHDHGVRTGWASLLGADRLGDVVAGFVSGRGVDTSLVERRPHPTGLYLKATTPDGVRPLYYRAGSAASTLDPAQARRWAEATRPRVVHVSGITAQISASARAFLEAVCIERVFGDAVVSFDVNHRPALAGPETPSHLLALAQASDIVFVGADEAETVWGVAGDGIRALIDRPAHLVVKDGGADATEHTADGAVVVPAPVVAVVEAVGAGDAFAGGWLAGYVRGAAAAERLASGHRSAGRVLRSRSDVADPPEEGTPA